MSSEKDRFVAFAFSCAELLMEVDAAGLIRFCAGSAQSLLGWPLAQLNGQSLSMLVAAEDAPVLNGFMDRLRRVRRVEYAQMRFRRADGGVIELAVSALGMAEFAGRWHLAINRPRLPAPDQPVVNGEDFRESLGQMMDSGTPLRMTLVEYDSDALASGLSPERVIEIEADIAGRLRSWSAGGAPVGHLAGGRWAVLHDPAGGGPALAESLCDIKPDPDDPLRRLDARANPVDLARDGMDAAQAIALAGHVLTGFVAGAPVPQSLGDAARLEASAARQEADRLMAASHPGASGMVFRPIRALADEATAIVEMAAPAPAPTAAAARRPFDAALVQAALNFIRRAPGNLPDQSLAVPVCIESLMHPPTLSSLIQMVDAAKPCGRSLALEVGGAPTLEPDRVELANRSLKALRDRHVKIIIADLGDGDDILRLLAHFSCDYIRLPAGFLMAAGNAHRGISFLRALCDMCQHLAITPIASGVEDQAGLKLMRAGGVTLAAGPIWGAALADPKDLAPLEPDAGGEARRSALLARRKGVKETWE